MSKMVGNEFSMHAKLSMYMLFAKYDVDASGEIDANELYKMILTLNLFKRCRLQYR